MQRLQSVTVNTHPQRRIIIKVVCYRCAEVGEKAILYRNFSFFIEPRIKVRQRPAHAEDVLTVRIRALLHLRAVKLVRHHVGLTVPFMPLQPGVIVSALRPPGDEHALGHAGIIPGSRHELIRHAIAKHELLGVRDFVPFLIPSHIPPYLYSRSAQRKSLLHKLLHFLAECVIHEHVLHKLIERVGVCDHAVLVGVFGPAI